MMLAIDPGINVCGCALFEFGQLHKAWLARTPRAAAAEDITQRVDSMAREVIEVIGDTRVDSIVVEWMQIYPGRRKKVDPNTSLLPLVGVVAAVSALLPAAAQRTSYQPRAWKGTQDGDACTRRIERHMTEAEKGVIRDCPAGLRHNVIDAVGIGLFHLGRLKKQRVISRGTP